MKSHAVLVAMVVAFTLLVIAIVAGCSSNERIDAPVGYNNPDTGHTADYKLDVEYNSDGTVEKIKFPNGGWEDDFVGQKNNGDGTVTLTDEDGRQFTVPSK
jgi:hypothetical protein